MFKYPATITKDGRNLLVKFKDVPEAITFGKTEADALSNAVDALETGLSFYVDARKPLPKPSKAKRGQKIISPSALESAKLGVYQAMMDQGIKKAELARRLGWHMPQIDRLFDLKHSSKFDQIEAAATVLGCHIEITVAA
ncbi:type II toxin-antitoxin system HicB family antitoxin [Polynucleobacter sp. AP-Elch-400A-B2]|uniref:type II toxin-antitoxin system HicB family antitoxin n=1 Tax=Polynucleobacter sp. AP-Elch-400A-B2 TaxID=2576930 RepID=UPI001BFE6B5A|nr:type II toxin-antitoxin system HicB family antitoxin [Polynucleobacter sp. AP-Elch-400A-B2]QWE24958.1 type II toxin-antitoxin system HicB family antitoxin [Polynucleobacter sp. AP-Elch-400A-B2]